MSFASEYLKLRQKKIDEEKEEEKKEKEKKEKEQKAWFTGGAFSDGYQFGDVTKTVLGTVNDVNENVTQAVADATENLVDTAAYGIGQVGGWFSKDFQNGVKDFIAHDYSKEAGEYINNSPLSAQSWISALIGGTDENSLLGGKSEGIVQSGAHLAGQAALQMVGVPWWLTSSVNSFGGEIESAFNEDATYGEAGISGAISAGAEILTEKLGGAFKFQGKALSDGLTDLIGKKVSSKVVKTLLKFGVDAGSEGFEEIASEAIGSFGKWITYQDEKTFNEMFFSEEAMDSYLEAFIGGAFLGGVGSGVNSTKNIKKGADPVTGLTKNEQSVVDKVYEKRVAESEKQGEKLSKKDKNKLYDETIEDMQKGNIDVSEIEEILGGDSYKAYKSETDNSKKLKAEYDELAKIPREKRNHLQDKRLAELDKMDFNDTSKADGLKKTMSDEVFNLVKGDRKGQGSILMESYREEARKGEAFKADYSQYKGTKYEDAAKQTIDNAIKAKANNTRKVHNIVDMAAKLSSETGMVYEFGSNETIKEDFIKLQNEKIAKLEAIENPTEAQTKAIAEMKDTLQKVQNGQIKVNGNVSSKGVMLNLDSHKALNRVVGHELTHTLEKTAHYEKLQKALFDYAKTKGVKVDEKIKELETLYKGVEGDAKGELTADLVGDYLFNDYDFVKSLSKDRNLFQKVWDEVKYIAKMAKPGSKEARELAKVERMFQKAYQEMQTEVKAQKQEADAASGDASFSLVYSKEIEKKSNNYFSKNKPEHISQEMYDAANETIQEMVDYMKPYLDITNNNGKRYLPEEIIGNTIFKNGSYGKTIENTTICYRTLAYIDFTNEVKKRIGRPLTVDESFLASQMLYDIANDPQCLYCYVSLDRKAYDGFLLEYTEQMNSVIEGYNSLEVKDKQSIDSLYKDFLDGRKDTKPMKARFNMWLDVAKNNSDVISLADLTTEEVRAKIINDDGVKAKQIIDAERYAQSASWAKKLEQYRSYNGEILDKMSADTVKKLNSHYGLRFYSFSEYTPAFIAENMQQIRDASLRGLYGLGYTKETDFANIFASTGMNINMSVFGKMVNGEVVPDTRQGANWDAVKDLRNKHKNVGAVFVATNDALVDWALEQDWIDVVIPFHIVRTGASVAEFYKWTNNTKFQADKDTSGKNKTISPTEHHNDFETFKRLVEERGLTPRFDKWFDNPNYMKLVNETRLSVDESTKLVPVFNEDGAKESFDRFVGKGGYYGNWYKDGVDFDRAVDIVANDVLAGKKANDDTVDYGRQDLTDEQIAELKKRKNKPRTHGQAIAPVADSDIAPTKFSLSDNSEFSQNEGIPIDNKWQNGYNLYTATDDFIRQVPYKMRHPFARSLANKTAGMSDGEIRTVYIYAGNVYVFRADGYMHGEMITSYVTNNQMLEEIQNEYDRIDQSAESASLWIEDVQSDEGGRNSYGGILGGGRSDSSDTLYEDPYERYTSRYTERERQAFETKEEADEIVKKLREMYGFDDSNGNSISKSDDISYSLSNSENNTDGENELTVSYNNKPFWIAMVNQRTGNIEATWTYEEAESEGFDLNRYEDVMEEDGYVFFTTDLLQDNDRIEYDDYGNRLPEHLIDRINEQIEVKHNRDNPYDKYGMSNAEGLYNTLKYLSYLTGDTEVFDDAPISNETVDDMDFPFEESFSEDYTFDDWLSGKNSLSKADDIAPVGRNDVFGKDFTVQEDIAPMATENTEGVNRVVNQNVNENVDDVTEDVDDSVETVDNKIAESFDGVPIITTKQQIAAKIRNAEDKLTVQTQRHNDLTKYFDSEIAKAQAELDSKKNKNTKVAQALAQRIETLTKRKADADVDFQKRTNDLNTRIAKLNDDLLKNHDRADNLERFKKREEAKLEAEKGVLAEEFEQRRADLQNAVGDKDAYITNRASELYKEISNLKKGVRASKELGYLLDHGYEWKSIKTALINAKNSPGKTVNSNSAAESTVREMLNEEYEGKLYELDELDAEYNEAIAKLETESTQRVEQFKVANQRMTKQQVYQNEISEMIGDTSTWQDKKMGLSYQTNTLHRNLRDVVRDKNGNRDIAKADAIYEYLQGSYNHNEALLKQESRKIKKPLADMDINKYESVYAQMLGEFKYNPETKLSKDVVDEYYNKHKDKIDTKKVDKAIEAARQTYDDLLLRVNEVLREQGMKEIPYRKGYFPHFTDDKQGFLAKLFNWKTKNNEIPTSIAGITETFEPNRSWQSFNKQRTSDTTDYNLLQGFDTYVHGALDWIYHIEDIQKRRAFEYEIRYRHSEEGVKEQIDKIKQRTDIDADEARALMDAVYAEKDNPLNNFVTDLRKGTQSLVNKKSSGDRGMEELTNRKAYSTMTNISNRVTANMVAGSVSSALTNFIPITQSWGQVSPISSLVATKDMIKNAIRSDGMIEKSDFMTNRLMQEENLNQTGWDKAGKVVGSMMEIADRISTEVVWRSKYMENVKNGMSENEAIHNADVFAENLMAGRSRGNAPTIFNDKNAITKMFTAFQLEVANQYGYMFKDMPQDIGKKNIGKLVKGYASVFIGAYVYNALYSALTGRDAAFSPLDILQDFFKDLGLGDEEEEELDVLGAVQGLGENVVQELPFVGGLVGGGRVPISSALPYELSTEGFNDFTTDINGMFNEEDNEKYKNSFLKELSKPLWYVGLPMGGGQIKKTTEGLAMFSDDIGPVTGSYTNSGNLRFPVEDTPWNRIQAGIFGQYSSANAREYFDEDYAPLNPNQTQEYADVGMSFTDYHKYRDGLKGLNTLAEKFDYIDSLDLTAEQKNILINNIVDRDEPVDMTDYGSYGDYEEFDFATKNPEKYSFFKENNISYGAYDASEESREAYNWAYNNPEKYEVSKAIGDVMTYRTYSKALNNLEADKDNNGNSISGSRKKKVVAYINNLDADYGAKIILYKTQYPSDDRYNKEIVEYLNARDDISYMQMVVILTELGMKVDANGKVTWD